MYRHAPISLISMLAAMLGVFVPFVPVAHATAINASLSMPPNNLGLTGWWTFDGANLIQNAADSSGSGNTAYLKSVSTTTTPGAVGQAFNFAAAASSQAHIDTTLTNLNFSSGTVSWWMKPASNTAGAARLFWGQMTSGNTTPEFSCQISTDNNWYCGWNTSGTDARVTFASSAADFTVSSWQLYTLVWTASGSTLYRNGVSIGSSVVAPAVSNINSAFVIDSLGSAYATASSFAGGVDDVRVYNRALTTKEISQLYNQSATPDVNVTLNPATLGNGLVGWWTFDGSEMSPRVMDSSDQGNDGRLTGATTTTPGVIGQALSLSGTANYVDLPTKTGFPTGSGAKFTLAAWAYSKSAANDGLFHFMVSYGSYSTSGRTPNLIISTGGKWRVSVWGSGNDLDGSAVTANTWTHLVGVSDGTKLYLYRNGVLNAGPLTVLSTIDPFLGTARIGTNNLGTNLFKGYLDDVRIYNRDLSPAEIALLFNLGTSTHVNASFTPPTLASSLVGWWTFDGPNMVRNVADLSGQGNNGALTGGTTTAPGPLGQALSFDGTTQFVRTGSGTSYNNVFANGVSLCVWSNIPDFSTFRRMVTIEDNTNNAFDVWLQANSGGIVQFGSGGTGKFKNGGSALTANKWNFVCGVTDYTSAGTIIYVNAVNNNGTVNSTPTYAATKGYLDIGLLRSAGSSFFGKGTFDDVRVFNRALTSKEVQQLYNLGH